MTSRRIDLHPELRQILLDWKANSEAGRYVIGGKRGRSLTVDEANRLFCQPLRGTAWCLDSKRNWFKIRFHTYRHSFVSNLAAKGVDQRVIDEFVGHSTEAMRRRYRHLFPHDSKTAIESFSLVAKNGDGDNGRLGEIAPNYQP